MMFRTTALLAALTPFVAQAQSEPPSDYPTGFPTSSMAPSPSPSAPPTINHFTSVHQHGQSGKITLYDTLNGDWETDPDAVNMTMDYLYELDANGKMVGKTGNTKHSMTELYGYTASTFAFETKISSIGKLKIHTYVMHEGGMMQTDTDETFEVFPGDFKFNIELVDWKWCNPCKDGTGAFVDVGIEIKGSSETPEEEDLGGGIPLVLASNIKIGDEVITMPDGYPKIVNEGGKSIFVFRFPKYGGFRSYLYDPIIGMGQRDVGDQSIGGGSGTGSSPAPGMFSICG